jgi:hypothetical protein
MKAIVFYLALSVFPAFGGSRIAPTHLYIDFQQDPPEVLLESIQEELANIMLPTTIEFEWRSLAASKGNEVSPELAVIHFKGTCSVTNLAPTKVHPGPLGWTDISDGEILPFSEINCDGIRLFMQRDLLRIPEVTREVAYGRAIARVLAHELYHIFARTTKHAAWGIGKPSFTVHELLSNKFQFEKSECDLLRAHHAHLVSISSETGQ